MLKVNRKAFVLKNNHFFVWVVRGGETSAFQFIPKVTLISDNYIFGNLLICWEADTFQGFLQQGSGFSGLKFIGLTSKIIFLIIKMYAAFSSRMAIADLRIVLSMASIWRSEGSNRYYKKCSKLYWTLQP